MRLGQDEKSLASVKGTIKAAYNLQGSWTLIDATEL